MEKQARRISFSRQRFYVSVLSIGAATLLLLGILAFSTLRNLDREQTLVSDLLQNQGKVIIEGIQAGARTSMMERGWSGNQLQRLIEEVGHESHLKFIALADGAGIVRFHSEADRIGDAWPDWERLRPHFYSSRARSYQPDPDTLVVYKRFSPMRPGRRRIPMHMGMLHWYDETSPMMILVGLDLAPYNAARKQDLWHALFMGVLLLLVGSAAFLGIFFLQNTYLTQRALEYVRAYYGLVVDSMPNSLLVLDKKDRVVTINPATERLFGFDLRVFRISGLEALFGDRAQRMLREIRESGQTLRLEETAETAAGDRLPVSVYGAMVRNTEGKEIGKVFLIQDLREIQELRQRMIQSERLAAVGSLAAGVAHEIRNPLSSIRGFAQLFKKKFPEHSREREYARIMETEVDRLDRVISALLDFARPRPPVLRAVDIEDLVRHVRSLIQERLERKGIRFETACPPDARVRADRDQLIQVLLNLFLNAVEAMETGGTLRVEAECGDDTCEIRVVDTGRGMDPATLDRIFDPFFTTKEKGMGLGLAVAQRIVEEHGGSLSARSRPGEGTTLILRLPKGDGHID